MMMDNKEADYVEGIVRAVYIDVSKLDSHCEYWHQAAHNHYN